MATMGSSSENDFVYAWREVLPDHAWGRWADAVAWLFDHIPLTRLFAAFENNGAFDSAHLLDWSGAHIADKCAQRPLSTRPSSLFDTCVRMVVPFGVIEAALQAQLPMMLGCATSTTTDTTEVESSDAYLIQDSQHWWVSVVRHFDSPCPTVGWLEPIQTRDAMRLAVHHWATLYQERCQLPCEPWPSNDYDDGTHYGLHFAAWLQVAHAIPPSAQEKASGRVVVCVGDVGREHIDSIKCSALRARAVERGRRLVHPWGSGIHVYFVPRLLQQWGKLIGWVDKDSQFLVDLNCNFGSA
jgi:hypothetical protein